MLNKIKKELEENGYKVEDSKDTLLITIIKIRGETFTATYDQSDNTLKAIKSVWVHFHAHIIQIRLCILKASGRSIIPVHETLKKKRFN